jgi:hypothetical protein
MAQNPDLHLWRAVLVAGLSDAAKGRETAWIGSPDFALVCHLALVDPVAVMRAHGKDRCDPPSRSRLRESPLTLS